jgi:hypothetical protein
MRKDHRLGSHWQDHAYIMEKAIKRDGLDNFRSNPYISVPLGEHVKIDPLAEKSLSWKAIPLRILVNLPVIRKVTNIYLELIRKHYDDANHHNSYYYEKEFGYLLEKYDLPETMRNGCLDVVTIKGQKISRVYIDHLNRIDKFSQHIDFSCIKTVMEIGGGFGINAHLLCHLFPNIRSYIYRNRASFICC